MTDDTERKAEEVEQGLLGFVCPKGFAAFSGVPRPPQDVWRKVGPDRVCSYCGSMHPEDLRAVLPTVDGERVTLELADKRHKVYVRRPGIRNASEGAIKFYLVHGPLNSDNEFWDLLNEKVRLCKRKLRERYER